MDRNEMVDLLTRLAKELPSSMSINDMILVMVNLFGHGYGLTSAQLMQIGLGFATAASNFKPSEPEIMQ